MRQLGAEGIVSKRRDSSYRGGERRDWVKVKVFDVGHFAVIGCTELGPGRLEAVHVADRAGFIRDGVLIPVIPAKAGC